MTHIYTLRLSSGKRRSLHLNSEERSVAQWYKPPRVWLGDNNPG